MSRLDAGKVSRDVGCAAFDEGRVRLTRQTATETGQSPRELPFRFEGSAVVQHLDQLVADAHHTLRREALE